MAIELAKTKRNLTAFGSLEVDKIILLQILSYIPSTGQSNYKTIHLQIYKNKSSTNNNNKKQ